MSEERNLDSWRCYYVSSCNEGMPSETVQESFVGQTVGLAGTVMLAEWLQALNWKEVRKGDFISLFDGKQWENASRLC